MENRYIKSICGKIDVGTSVVIINDPSIMQLIKRIIIIFIQINMYDKIKFWLKFFSETK